MSAKKLHSTVAAWTGRLIPVGDFFQLNGIDLLECFLTSNKVNKWIVTITEYFTRCDMTKALCNYSDVTYEVEDFEHSSRRRMSKDVVHVLCMMSYRHSDAQNSCGENTKKQVDVISDCQLTIMPWTDHMS